MNQLIPHLKHDVELSQWINKTMAAKNLDDYDLIYIHYGGLLTLWNHEELEILEQDIPVVAGLRGEANYKRWCGSANNQYIANDYVHKLKAISCSNKSLKERISQLTDVPAYVTPSGVDTKYFKPSPPPNEFCIGWAGYNRIAGVKGYERLADLKFPLKYITGRPYSEMPDFYKSISVYICVSYEEGSPVVHREALASGRPVLSTRVGDVEDFLPDEWIFDDHKKMNELLEYWSKIDLSNMVKTARKLSHKLSYKRVAKTYNAMFDDVFKNL